MTVVEAVVDLAIEVLSAVVDEEIEVLMAVVDLGSCVNRTWKLKW